MRDVEAENGCAEVEGGFEVAEEGCTNDGVVRARVEEVERGSDAVGAEVDVGMYDPGGGDRARVGDADG